MSNSSELSHASRHGGRHGARQPRHFDPARAPLLDDPARFEYLPPGEVEKLLNAPSGAVVVDFGTGTGTYALELARRRPDIEVIALDEQPEMLALLKAKHGAENLANLRPSLPSELFGLQAFADRVMALNVLHEASDEALESIRIMLKPEGLALWIDWNAAVDRPVGPPRDHVYTPEEARARLEGFEFQIDREFTFLFHYGFLTRVHPAVWP
jgi:SAM-dependent methyltransferase